MAYVYDILTKLNSLYSYFFITHVEANLSNCKNLKYIVIDFTKKFHC